MKRLAMVEALAAAAGLAGTILLANNGPHAGWGFVAYLVSNAGWLAFGLAGRHWFLVLQQLGFTVTSVYGIYRWLL
jgi:hypothetical protein